MLVQFTVENFRVFREPQTFSMVASSLRSRGQSNSLIESGWTAAPKIHRLASIYGANGAGKTSLLEAIHFMKRFIRSSVHDISEEEIEVQPFLYDHKSRDKPSRFEIAFIHNNFLYEYGFSISKDRVEEEWLCSRPKSTGRQRQLFIREFNKENDEYEWYINPSHIKGERDKWKSQTRPNALFLTIGAQLNNRVLLDVYKWITRQLTFISLQSLQLSSYTAQHLSDPEWKDRLIDFFELFDIRISDVYVEKLEPNSESAFTNSRVRKNFEVNFIRNDDKQHPIFIPYEEEALGTRTLFNFAWPLLISLDKGRTLLIDELNASLHTLIFQKIISLFNDEDFNRLNSQLIFSTHDAMAAEIESLDRDQIWLIEKDNDLSSRLYAVSDFKGNSQNNFGHDYLLGRYGAVPNLY